MSETKTCSEPFEKFAKRNDICSGCGKQALWHARTTTNLCKGTPTSECDCVNFAPSEENKYACDYCKHHLSRHITMQASIPAATLKRMHEDIEERASIAISEISAGAYTHLIEDHFIIKHPVILPSTGALTSFDWTGGEPARTPAFCKQLASRLGRLRGHQLIDIHTRTDSLKMVLLGRKLKGKADLLLTAHMAPYDSKSFILDFVRGAKFVFELKAGDLTPQDERQIVGQLLCASTMSQFQVVGCLTNGSKWRFYSILRNTITVTECDSWDAAVAFIKSTLSRLGNRIFQAPLHKDRKKDDEGGDDEGDEDEGDEDEGDDGEEDDDKGSSSKGNKKSGKNASSSKGQGSTSSGKGSTSSMRTVYSKSSTKTPCLPDDWVEELPDHLEDQLGIFSRRELQLAHFFSYPDVRMFLEAACI